MTEVQQHIEEPNTSIDPLTACIKTIDTIFEQLERRYLNSMRGLEHIPEISQEIAEAQDIKLRLQRATARMCGEASRQAALTWLLEYPNMFDGITLIEGCDTVRKPTKEWTQHTIAVGHARDGRFYGISPANYKGDLPVEKSRLVYQGDTWEELIQEIEDAEGCLWPNWEDVQDSMYLFMTRPHEQDGPSDAALFPQVKKLPNGQTFNNSCCVFRVHTT